MNSSGLVQALSRAHHSINLLSGQDGLFTTVLKNFKNLYSHSNHYILEHLQRVDPSVFDLLLNRELLHSQDYTYLQSLGAKSFLENHHTTVAYLTPLNLNILPFRAKAGIHSLPEIYTYTLRSLLRFALTAHASISIASLIFPALRINHVLAVDIEPVMLDFVRELFQSDKNIVVQPIDLSEYSYASDIDGHRPPLLSQTIASVLSSISIRNKTRLIASVNLDSDDLISPLHPGLVAKYISLVSSDLLAASYLCFPLGLQYDVHNDFFYSYSGCSNCFMAALSGNRDQDLLHVWNTAHDRLNPVIPYRNVSTWHPVWAECIWNANISNQIWPSSLQICDQDPKSAINFLFGIQRSMLQMLSSLEGIQ